jgi:hypothetical protein
MRSIITAFFIMGVICGQSGATDYVIPSSRSITWQGNVGVSGGIPTRTTQIDCTQSPYNVPTNGSSACQTAINSCLNGISSGQTAYLPAGTYIITGGISIPSNKTLRGAGMSQTIIQSNSDISYLVNIGSGNATSNTTDISSGYTKGLTQIVVSSGANYEIGDLLLLDELNDSSIPVTRDGSGGTCTWCGRYGTSGTRSRMQIVQVTGKSTNTIDFTPALYFTFSSSNSPQASKLTMPILNAGVENLTIKNGTGTNNSYRTNLLFLGSSNSWVKGVKIDTCGSRCIDVQGYNFRTEVRENYITNCLDHVNSDQCYGSFMGQVSGTLVEHNVYNSSSEGPMIGWGASGNVIGYNYSYGTNRTQNATTWFWPDWAHHGAHTAYNLFEGNIFVGLAGDEYWGSCDSNTYFRNRILAKNQTTAYELGVQNVYALEFQKNNHNINVIGNILGTSGWNTVYEKEGVDYSASTKVIYKTGYVSNGDLDAAGNDHITFTSMLRHANYDYVTYGQKFCGDSGEPGCQGGPTDVTLPASLYLTNKPSIFGSLTYPPVNPSGPTSEDIPAKVFYDTGSWPTEGATTYTLTYQTTTCASITGTNPQSGIASGHDGTQVTAVPATGYHFVQWDDALATAARTDTNVTADHTYTASCAVNAASGRRSGGVATGGVFR